jgi:hypothetical protein
VVRQWTTKEGKEGRDKPIRVILKLAGAMVKRNARKKLAAAPDSLECRESQSATYTIFPDVASRRNIARFTPS